MQIDHREKYELRNTTQIPGSPHGFTLLELLLASFLFLILMLGAFLLLERESKAILVQQEVREARENLEAALRRLCQDLKMAGSFPSHAALETMDPSSLTLLGNFGDRGLLERVTYFLDGTILRRRENRLEGNAWQSGSALPVADNITDLSFQFLNEEGLPAGDCGDVARIIVEISGCSWYEDPGFQNGFDLNPGLPGTARNRHLGSTIVLRR